MKRINHNLWIQYEKAIGARFQGPVAQVVLANIREVKNSKYKVHGSEIG
jgi:hypothetical protein